MNAPTKGSVRHSIAMLIKLYSSLFDKECKLCNYECPTKVLCPFLLFLVFPMIILPCHKSENNLFLLIHFSYRNCSFKVKSKTLSLIISWCEKRAIEMLKKIFTPFLKNFPSLVYLLRENVNVGFCGLFGYIKHSSFIDLIITKWPALKISALV